MERLTFRLTPGADLLVGIRKKVEEQRIETGYMMTCVGSLSQAVIRFADQEHEEQLPGPFEILSLSGTVSIHGSHLHVGLADSSGKTVGGHLMEGCRVYTTAEIVLGGDYGKNITALLRYWTCSLCPVTPVRGPRRTIWNMIYCSRSRPSGGKDFESLITHVSRPDGACRWIPTGAGMGRQKRRPNARRKICLLYQ